MIGALKGWLFGGLALVVVLSSLGNIIGLYKVHDKLAQAENLRVEAAQEKSFQEVNNALDNAIKVIDERTDTSKESLEEILDDARKESVAIPAPAPTIVRIESPAPPVEKSEGSDVSRPSGTTVRTVDILWINYCTTFPSEPGCGGQAPGKGTVRPSTTSVQGSGGQVKR